MSHEGIKPIQYNITFKIEVPSYEGVKKAFYSTVDWMGHKVEWFRSKLTEKNVKRALWAGAALLAVGIFGASAYNAHTSIMSLIDLSARFAQPAKVGGLLVYKLVTSITGAILSAAAAFACFDNAIGR